MSAPPDDVDRIMAVMACAFDPQYGEAWTRRQVEDALVLGRCHYLLAAEDGELPDIAISVDKTAGFALTRTSLDEEELLLFAVVPQLRRRGVGDRLLARFIAEARGRGAQRLLLEMRSGNPAETLYRRHGFMPVGLRRNYYRSQNGCSLDAITFECKLFN